MSQRVVIIDDDTWQGDIFERSLVAADFLVSRAGSGHAAIDIIDTARPRVILLDVLLGDTTAPALLHELQSHNDLAQIPVILATNIADRIEQIDFSNYGVVAVLDKTRIDPEDVVLAVRKAMQ